ncbi:MAG: TIR domain-containing protein [Gammaproteobacteria bacterium]|nr:TIR domain-containing protein [Gammaproteobacteria bacterium]
MSAHDLFVSYAREDAEWVERLCSQLQAQGLKVWKDSAIPTGRSFGRVIEKAIADAKAVVVVWSISSVESDWVRAEAMEGLKRDVLVPLLKDPCEPPLRYRTLQTSDLSGWRFEPDYPEFLTVIAACRDLTRNVAHKPAESHSPITSVSSNGSTHWARPGVLVSLALLLVIAATAAWWQWMDNRHQQRSLELTASAEAALAELEARHRSRNIYWRFLLDRESGQSLIERAVLLSLEAIRHHPSPRTLDVLRSSLVLLPRSTTVYRAGNRITQAIVANGGSLVGWSQNEIIHSYDLNDPEASHQLDTGNYVARLMFSDTTYPLFAVGNDGSVTRWQPQTGDNWQISDATGKVEGIAFSEQNHRLALRQAGWVNIWDLDTGELSSRIPSADHPLLGTDQNLDLSPDGSLLAIAARERIHLWALASGEHRYQIDFKGQITGIKFDPSGDSLTGASTTREVKVIGTRSGQIQQQFQGSPARLTVFSHTGDWVARGHTGQVIVAAVGSQAEPYLSYGHDDNVTDIVFAPDGKLLASAGQGGLVRVWELAERREILRYGFPSKVLSVGFSRDGKVLYAVAANGEIVSLPLSYTDPIDEACSALQRDLSLEEWKLYLPDEPYRRRCTER